MERLIDKLREYLELAQGRVVDLKDLRVAFNIEPGSKEDGLLRKHMSSTLVKEKKVIPSGRRDSLYKVIKQVQPVRVFAPDRERRPIFNFNWPIDKQNGMPISIGEHIVLREGDFITIGGVKSKGKTTLMLNLAAANIDRHPILMGNEYTIYTDGHYEPAPRFLSRLDKMSEWVEWTDENGQDKFTLLPVKEDYAEHIVRDGINLIDWINLDANQLYEISKTAEGIKAAVGRGVVAGAIQKGEGAINPRGGQFVRDFSDVEILLDSFGGNDDNVLLTIKGCKEKTAPIVGKTYAFSIVESGTAIWNFREVKKCPACRGNGYTKSGECDNCLGRKYVDV
jgi:hypothetical protein